MAGLTVAMLVANTAILGSYNRIESQSAASDVERVRLAFTHEEDRFGEAAQAWTASAVVVDALGDPSGNHSALEAAFSHGESFTLLDGNRSIVASSVRDAAGLPTLAFPVPAGIQDVHHRGILLVQGAARFVAVCPVGANASRGTLLWSKPIGPDTAQSLTDLGQVETRIIPWDALDAARSRQLGSDQAVSLTPRSPDQLEGLVRADGIDGNPALALQVHMPRPIFQQGVRTLAYVLSSGVLVGGVVMASVVLALDRAVISPVRSLTERVHTIRQMGILTQRVDSKGDDEIAALATEFNRLLERLESDAGQLERSNQDLRQFAAVVGHDMQGPLSTIAMNAAILRERHQPDPDELARIERIEATSLRLADRIRAILDYSRATFEEVVPEPVDLNRVMAEVATDLEGRLAATGGELRSGDLPTVLGNPVQLAQLLLNLVGNGLKHHRPGIPPIVTVSATTEERVWRLQVSDNGRGFDASQLERMMRPYLRLDSSRDTGGHGLGLATCGRIVARHGGTLSATAQVGQGATFIVELPRPGPAPVPAGLPHGAAQARGAAGSTVS